MLQKFVRHHLQRKHTLRLQSANVSVVRDRKFVPLRIRQMLGGSNLTVSQNSRKSGMVATLLGLAENKLSDWTGIRFRRRIQKLDADTEHILASLLVRHVTKIQSILRMWRYNVIYSF